jgi:hypothetical protein
MNENIYNWEPMTPEQVCQLLRDAPAPWWIAGGWAIDLFLGRQTRSHGDADVLIQRKDQLVFQEFLFGWDLHKTKQPGLRPWPKGEFLNPGINDVWGRRTEDSPWSLQFMLLDTMEGSWVFRRDPTISGAMATLRRVTDSGIPYLSPEIQLLYKARPETLAKDDLDFQNCVQLLGTTAQKWLLSCLKKRLPPDHRWIVQLKEELVMDEFRALAENNQLMGRPLSAESATLD